MVEDHQPQWGPQKKVFLSDGYSEICVMELEDEWYREL